MKWFLCWVLSIYVMAFTAIAQPIVAVSIPPQKFLVEQIGGGAWSCVVVIDKGQDPHLFEPTPRQLLALRKCDVYFKIGLPFESVLVDKLAKANPRLRVVGVTNAVDHAHGTKAHEDSVSDHEGDPHIWMSPDEIVELSAEIASELSILDPSAAATYSLRQTVFAEKMLALKQSLSKRLHQAGIKTILVYHPAWGHFAEAFELEQVAIEAQGQTPGARHLDAVSEKVKQQDVKVMLVQSETERRRIAAFAARLGLRIAIVYPLAEDVVGTMRATVDALCGDSTHE